MTPSIISQNKILKFIIPLAFWLGVWQVAAILMGYELLLPTPLTVFRTLITLGATTEFWYNAGVSLVRIFGGFFIGMAIGTLCAIVSACTPWAHLILGSGIKVIRAIPVASFIVLVLLWSSTTMVPVIVGALMVIPVLWGNVYRGIVETSPQLLEAARAYRFSPWKKIRLVYIPSVMPYFASAANTALGLAWKAGVAAEVICQPQFAIGTRMYRAKITLETPDIFAWTILVVVLSLLLEHLLNRGLRGVVRGMKCD